MNSRLHALSCSLKTWMVLGAISSANAVHADVFLDLTSVTPGGPGVGAFSGTLGGVLVTGTITGAVPAFFVNMVGKGLDKSTLDGSSPQFSYAAVFSPTVPATDRVGFTYWAPRATWSR